jgi:WD40 repeat protein
VQEDAVWGTEGVEVKWDNGHESESWEDLRWGFQDHGVENIDIVDSAGGGILHTLKGHSYQVMSVAITPDGSKIVSGSTDETIK